MSRFVHVTNSEYTRDEVNRSCVLRVFYSVEGLKNTRVRLEIDFSFHG